MWVIVNDAFVSVVADRDSKRLLVRARMKGDIEAAFQGHALDVIHTPTGADYAYRAFVSRADMKAMLRKQVDRIVYDNFKDSVESKERHDVYLQMWGIMKRWQDRALAALARAPQRSADGIGWWK